MTRNNDKNLIVLLHGFGSNGNKWNPLIAAWRPVLTRSIFAAPDALYPCGEGGFKWFDGSETGEASSSEMVVAARADFDEMLRSVIVAENFTDRVDRVALVGFSQGATMALDVLVSGRWPVAAVVAFAGRLRSHGPIVRRRDVLASIIHSDADPVVPATESQRIALALRRHGIQVERRIVNARAHGISPEAAEIASAFLWRVLEKDSSDDVRSGVEDAFSA
jgi:phospholipase/carboxylesterase